MRGIDEDWLRRKRGRVTAVRCAVDCPRVFPPPLAVKTRSMCGSLVFARSSRGPRRASALCLCLGLGLRVRQRTRAQHGPTVLRWLPRGGRASTSVEVEPSLVLGRAAGAALPLVRRAAALRGGRLDSGGLCPLGTAPGRRRGGRARRRSVALPVWAGAYVEARWSGRLVSRRDCSTLCTDSVRFPPRENGADRGGRGARC